MQVPQPRQIFEFVLSFYTFSFKESGIAIQAWNPRDTEAVLVDLHQHHHHRGQLSLKEQWDVKNNHKLVALPISFYDMHLHVCVYVYTQMCRRVSAWTQTHTMYNLATF